VSLRWLVDDDILHAKQAQQNKDISSASNDEENESIGQETDFKRLKGLTLQLNYTQIITF